MKKSSVDPVLALEAKMIVALAFRNGPIEDLHTGKFCPTCSADSAYSRISDEEMKGIMKLSIGWLLFWVVPALGVSRSQNQGLCKSLTVVFSLPQQ